MRLEGDSDGGDVNSSTSHTSNPKTRTFDCSGTLTTGGKGTVSYKLSSADAQVMPINDKPYDLSQGRVFMINAAGQISHTPFAPLDASKQYVMHLEQYVDANKGLHGTSQQRRP